MSFLANLEAQMLSWAMISACDLWVRSLTKSRYLMYRSLGVTNGIRSFDLFEVTLPNTVWRTLKNIIMLLISMVTNSTNLNNRPFIPIREQNHVIGEIPGSYRIITTLVALSDALSSRKSTNSFCFISWKVVFQNEKFIIT